MSRLAILLRNLRSIAIRYYSHHYSYSVLKDHVRHHISVMKGFGGAKRDRTADLLLARQALSQLSYGPIMGYIIKMVGPSGLEPPTSPLSGVRSNQLS